MLQDRAGQSRPRRPDRVSEDFLIGFVVDNDHVWGRPVGVAVAHDGALLVTEDGNGTIWRVAFGAVRWPARRRATGQT